MVRIDPDIYETSPEKRGCGEMDFTCSPIRGFVFFSQEGTRREKDLEYWMGLALTHNKIAKKSKEN